jgi:hypothetical protein
MISRAFHLSVIEHYVGAFIKTEVSKEFFVEPTKLTFGQKIALIGTMRFPEQYDFVSYFKTPQLAAKLIKDPRRNNLHIFCWP